MFGSEPEKPKPPPPKEIKFTSAQFKPSQLDGYTPYKNCRITGLAEFLCETNLTRCTVEIFPILKDKTQNTQINETKYGTANIDIATGEFTFSSLPLYIPSGYPNYKAFSSPIKYKAVISATRHTAPLEFFLELSIADSVKPVVLKRGMYDDNACSKFPDNYTKGTGGYVHSTPILELQKRSLSSVILHQTMLMAYLVLKPKLRVSTPRVRLYCALAHRYSPA